MTIPHSRSPGESFAVQPCVIASRVLNDRIRSRENFTMSVHVWRTTLWALTASMAVIGIHRTAAADTISIGTAKDNSIIQPLFVDPTSNGMGDGMFVGRSGVPHTVRAVMAFDLSAIPAGSTITSVTLRLHMTQAAQIGKPEQTQTLHRMLANWGEGASVAFGGTGSPAEPGDVTWLHSFFPDQYWLIEGGDVDDAISASTVVGTIVPGGIPVPFTWTSPQMAADVQAWLSSPATNFGWMLRGDELEEYTARRYATREYLDVAARPVLTVEFTPPQPCAADINYDNMVNVQDLLAVIGAWGTCPQPCPPACTGDTNADCTVNVQDLLAVITTWGPCQ